MKAAVLLLTWRRPHTTRRVIDAIRPFAPDRLYVASDGPIADHADEFAKVADTRALVERMIDWDCRIERLYSDINQGCRLAVSRAITWFFQHEEEGIILEDDCVPHPDFFSYCQILLEHYRDDDRIWCISGNNFQDGQKRGDGSYYFSHYPHCWGWASWRRCWQCFDSDLSLWPSLRDSSLLQTIFPTTAERLYWSAIWEKLYKENKPDSWAYRWTFTCMSMGGLTALPNRNLVSNIGFGADATHTTDGRVSHVMEDGSADWTHPKFVFVDADADSYTFLHHIEGSFLSRSSILKTRIIDPISAKIETAIRSPFHYPSKLKKILAGCLGVSQ